MSRFRRFEIQPKDAEFAKCNARVRSPSGTEAYCEATPVEPKTRCPDHNPYTRSKAYREEADIARLVDSKSIDERSKELAKNKRNLTDLKEQVLRSLATIQQLEERYPIETIQPREAIEMAKLREKHTDLVHKRVDLEIKLKAVLDSDWLWEKTQELFEKRVTDENTRQVLLEGVGQLLDEMVQGGGAKPR